MKNLALVVVMGLSVMPAFAATGRGGQTAQTAHGRVAMSGQAMSAPRVSAIKNVNTSASPVLTTDTTVQAVEEVLVPEQALAVPPEEMQPAEKDKREKEKLACISNNIGVGNTFVWASRYSNTTDYSMMVEDVENPENNVSFVKVGVKSDDDRIRTDDIKEKYFVWGQDIECGSWVDSEMMRQRILDAKKKGRAWATVGAAVGGAGLGVGIMEVGGNKLIAKMGGEKVEGQKALEGVELLSSQLVVLKKESKAEYDIFMADLKKMRDECAKLETNDDENEAKKACDEWKDYFGLVTAE